jgi:hypothetical protein
VLRLRRHLPEVRSIQGSLGFIFDDEDSHD